MQYIDKAETEAIHDVQKIVNKVFFIFSTSTVIEASYDKIRETLVLYFSQKVTFLFSWSTILEYNDDKSQVRVYKIFYLSLLRH